MSTDATAVAIQRQFLPAAIEAQETPPSPTGRVLLWLLISLFVLAVFWAVWGRVDIVVTAAGRVIPSGHIKLVQAGHSGTIAGIDIAEGRRVSAGDALIRLDATQVNSEISRLDKAITTVLIEMFWRVRLEQWLNPGISSPSEWQLPDLPDAPSTRKSESLLQEKTNEFTATILSMEKELSSSLADLDALDAERQRVLATLNVLSERVEAYKTLVANQYGARVQYLELLQQQTDLEQSLPTLEAQRRKLQAGANALNARITAHISETRSQNLAAISRLDVEKSSLSHDLTQTVYSKSKHTIRAPVSGTVEELAFHTIGGVIQAGQAVLNIVPEGVSVEVDALLENKDIGFIHEGLAAEVKIETFNFTRYGVVQASVINISDDAIEDKAGMWKYPMKLGLESQHITVGDKILALTPGMSASVEIKIGTRRIIEFLLAPLLRYKHESIRER